MNKKIYLSALCALAINLSAQDLGVIQVESSTIDDKFESKRTEVSSTSTVSGQQVEDAHAENIQQILQSVPGITTEVQGGDSLKIHIRGIENQVFMGEKPGVAIVIDGVPVFERTGKVNIDLDNIQSIKVIKGGASYLFGDDALSGAVIITTKKGAKNAGSKIEVEGGSYGYKKILAKFGQSEENYNYYIQASQRTKDGYHEDSDYATNYLNGKLQYYVNDSSDLTFGFEYSDRDKDSHGSVTGVTEAQINPKSTWTAGNDRVSDYASQFDVSLLKLFLTYSKDFSDDSNLLFNIYQYGDDTEYLSGNPSLDINHDTVANPLFKESLNEYEQIQRGLKSEYRASLKNSAYMIGLDLRANQYNNYVTYANDWSRQIGWFPNVYLDYNKGTITSDDTTNESIYAIYGEYKYQFSKDWSATTNLRFDNINLDYTDNLTSTNVDKTINQYSYRIGLNNQINEIVSFYSAFSTGFRAPSVKQLFYGDINPSGDVESNPDLKPEVANSFDIGLRGTTKLFDTKSKYEAGLFLIDRDDYIMSSSGQYGLPTSGNKSQYQNIGGMRSQGLELAFNTDQAKTIAFNVAYSYIDATFTKYDNYNLVLGNPYNNPTIEPYDLTGNDIPRVSKHNLNFILDYNINKNFKISPEVKAISSYYADELNRNEIPGHGLINLMTSYNDEFSDYKISIFARVDNVLDKTYYNSARGYRDSDKDGDYDQEDLSLSVNEGRVITAGLSVKF